MLLSDRNAYSSSPIWSKQNGVPNKKMWTKSLNSWSTLTVGENIFSDPKFLLTGCVFDLGSCHILIDLRMKKSHLNLFNDCTLRFFGNSTFDIGINKFSFISKIVRTNKFMKTAKAAFSKSLSASSIGRNSTRQPIVLLIGGNLMRTESHVLPKIDYAV